MPRHVSFILTFIACTALGCKSENNGSTKAPPTKPPIQKPVEVDRSALVPMASETLGALVELETQADVTCWTSFRQLDWYIAEKTYSEFATLAKVTAIKGLARALWLKASAASEGPLTAKDFTSAIQSLEALGVPEAKRSELTGFANDIGLRNYTDYQKTAEHWRVVLAVVQDEIFYGSGGELVKPATGPALEAFADGATTLSLHLLKRSGKRATADKADEIETRHIRAAFSELATELGLKSKKREVKPLAYADSIKTLAPLTQKLIEGKGKALVTFNRASGDLAADLNRVAELPLDPAAAQVFYTAALSFVRFATSGADPMRADNYLSDGSFEKTSVANTPYLSHLALHNVVEQIFPHRVLANGDVVVRFEPNPGPMTVGKIDLTPFEIRMLDHRMNGVRDSAVHWKAMADLFTRRQYAIDPFAAEYLSEVVSMMVTLYIERAALVAKKSGAKTISADIAKQVTTSRAFTQVPVKASDRPAWDKKWASTKAAALGKLKEPLFADVSRTSGLPKDVKLSSPTGGSKFNIQTIMGSGVAVGDVNNDGYADVYLAGDGLGRLVINRGEAAPGTFVDETERWKLPAIDDGHGCLFFDIEGDGDLDLVVLRSENPSMVFRQEGGAFVDAASTLGIKTGRGAHSAHVFDYDADGDLDLYVGYYGAASAHKNASQKSLPSLDGRNGSPNQLWRNDGASFTEVAALAGVADVGWTLAIGSFDYERDGDLDLYLANDFGANALYRNDGGGKFTDITAETRTGDRGSGMNVDFSDINGDGAWDFYVTNIDMFSKRIKVVFPRDESTIDIDRELAESFQYLSGNKLYLSGESKGALRSAEQELMEPGDRGWGWDALFFDYDNDGDDDLYMTNGWVDGSYAGNQKNQMFVFEKVFHLAPPSSPEAVAGNTRSVAAADFDRDGDIDLILNQFRKPPVMLENRLASKNGWLRLALKGPGKNPRAIGALITVRAGDKTILRQVTAGRGYISQADTEILVGLGAASSATVEVQWPDGKKSSHPALAAGKRHELAP